jgi:hypothetical protein
MGMARLKRVLKPLEIKKRYTCMEHFNSVVSGLKEDPVIGAMSSPVEAKYIEVRPLDPEYILGDKKVMINPVYWGNGLFAAFMEKPDRSGF